MSYWKRHYILGCTSGLLCWSSEKNMPETHLNKMFEPFPYYHLCMLIVDEICCLNDKKVRDWKNINDNCRILFVGGFKGENKSRFAKRQAQELKEKAVVHEEPKNTTIEFAIRTQKVIRTFCLFCHGLLAGLSAWHIVIAYVLLDFGDMDFILHYRKLALPVQCIFYILLVLCTWSALDR